jgi:uncharacterized protein (DUF983 family)
MASQLPSSFMCGIKGRCPRCGTGNLFNGLLTIAPACPQCGLSLGAQDSGDGPVFFVLVIVGFLSVGLASIVEIAYAPPLWLHALLWIPFTLIASVVCMRFFKAWLIALQYKHNPDGFQ